jgi:hypothetical protein
LDQAGPLSFEGQAGSSHSPSLLGGPGYGRDPVGKGQAAAGFSAGRALVAAEGATAGRAIVSVGLAVGLAAFIAFFFFPAFFFFLADFFDAAFFLPAFFSFFFFPDDLFFFFFFPPFFAFFLAMLISFKVVEQKKPGR